MAAVTRNSRGTKLDVSAVGSEHQKRTAPRAVDAWCRRHGFHGSPLCAEGPAREGSRLETLPAPWAHFGHYHQGAAQPRRTRRLGPDLEGCGPGPDVWGRAPAVIRGASVQALATKGRVSPDPAGFPQVPPPGKVPSGPWQQEASLATSSGALCLPGRTHSSW